MQDSIDELSISKLNNHKYTKGDLFIKNGCVVYHEESLLTENHKQVNQAIAKFRDWRAQYESKNTSVTASDIPQPYTDLVALLAHESEENLKELAQRINNILSPFGRNEKLAAAFTESIEQIIKVTAYQERYGLADVILLLKDAPSSIPKRLSIYRWQAYDTTRFPTDIVQAASKQREKRKLFSRLFTDAFQELSTQEKIDLLYNEHGTFFADPGGTKHSNSKDFAFHHPKDHHKKNNEARSRTATTATVEEPLFNEFQPKEHVIFAPTTRQPRKRLCSSFDTLFYVGLNNTFDLRQRFLDELSPDAKRKRGLPSNSGIDLKQAWLESITTTGRSKNYDSSPMYKKIRSLKMKLLLFHEDVRPAYYGTWTKALGRNIVNGKRPFAKDTEVLNYEYDSEAEWDHDVEGDDIHTLSLDEDDDRLSFDSSDDEEEDEPIGREVGANDVEMNDEAAIEEEGEEEEEEEEYKWVVPEGYLSEDEGTYEKRRHNKHRRGIVSRPAKWPISGNKHFPMKSVILGPSFESFEEPENHPLSDFKIHTLIDLQSSNNNRQQGYSPFNTGSDTAVVDSTNHVAAEETPHNSNLLTVCVETNKIKSPSYQREIDKVVNSYKEELINIVLDNKTKTMMGLVTVLKSKKIFSEFTTAQLQAMIHDVAIQEMRGGNKEYNWYLRVASASVA